SCFFQADRAPRAPHSFPTRRSSDLGKRRPRSGNPCRPEDRIGQRFSGLRGIEDATMQVDLPDAAETRSFLKLVELDLERASFCRSEEHTSELQSLTNIVCRLLLAKK